MLDKVVIKKGKEIPVMAGHPWVFSGAFTQKYDKISHGSVVNLFSEEGKFLAKGFYNDAQSISFRVISFDLDLRIDENFFYNKLVALNKLKTSSLSSDTTGFRLVNSDADYLPGLVVDVYNNLAVFQISILGMELCQRYVIEALKKLGFEHIIEKSDSESRKSEGMEVKDVILHHGIKKDTYEFLEHGIKMLCDPFNGQKTGYFLDQKDARFWLKNNAKDYEVINLFSYSGAFSISAIFGGAKEVISVDTSQSALDLAKKIFEINNCGNKASYSLVKANVLDYVQQGFDSLNPKILICDPPAFAKNKGALKNATNAYIKLNQRCLENLKSGDVFITSSCSGLIKMEDFYYIVKKGAFNASKKLRLLKELKQSSDHTMILGFKEGEYLKTLILQVI